MRLNTISDNKGARKQRKRVGRGAGSGTGQTAGRGMKGQTSRSGVSINGFEGGQMPIYRRLPKRGFNKPNRLDWAEVNLGRLQAAIDAKKIDVKKPIDIDVMLAAGLINKRRDGVRLLGNGELKSKVNLVIDHATKSASEAVEKAGGSITLVDRAAAPANDDKAKDK